MRERIMEILTDRGEAILNDAGVDADICTEIAEDIVREVCQRHVVVAEQGGMCIDVIIDGCDSVEFERLDLDCMGVGEPITLSEQGRRIVSSQTCSMIDTYNRSLEASD